MTTDPPIASAQPRHAAPAADAGALSAPALQAIIAEFAATPGPSPTVLLPVFNDWPSLAVVLDRLDAALAGRSLSAQILVIDDASSIPPPADFASRPYIALKRVLVLSLRRNLGHQRAIAVGLSFASEAFPLSEIAVMDADGEDKPEDLPGLIAVSRLDPATIIFAQRTRRTESLLFRVFYILYCLIHRILTGMSVRFGNFSVIPPGPAARIVVASELWNHYPASVVKCKLPFDLVPLSRGTRVEGRSRMNFTSLVIHGLSAIAVYNEIVCVRLLIAAATLAVFAGGALLATIGVRVFTNLAVPGWATYTTGILIVLMLQAATIAMFFIFAALSARQSSTIIPLRDYRLFVLGLREASRHP